jgi:hypothetical protein
MVFCIVTMYCNQPWDGDKSVVPKRRCPLFQSTKILIAVGLLIANINKGEVFPVYAMKAYRGEKRYISIHH